MFDGSNKRAILWEKVECVLLKFHLPQILTTIELAIQTNVVLGSFCWKVLAYIRHFDLKTGVKIFGRCKNNGIVQCPLLQISTLFQGKPVIMDAIKLTDEKFS